jgi:hypothetical protein
MVKDDEMKLNFDEEMRRLMKSTNESLERLRSFTSRCDMWYEGHKALFIDEGFQVSVTDLPREREAMSIVIDIT